MAKMNKDESREARIHDEILVDAYDAEEKAMSWYYYLEEILQFPFAARCVKVRAASPLRVGDNVKVLKMAPEEECLHEMFVMIRWEKKSSLAVPLSSLEPVVTNKDTGEDETSQQAVEDWRYWANQGYQF